jgi:hypothetical protein
MSRHGQKAYSSGQGFQSAGKLSPKNLPPTCTKISVFIHKLRDRYQKQLRTAANVRDYPDLPRPYDQDGSGRNEVGPSPTFRKIPFRFPLAGLSF